MRLILLFLAFLLLMVSVLAMPPPDVLSDACVDSGGRFINYECVCPIRLDSEFLACWVISPSTACISNGGSVTDRESEGFSPIMGPPGCNWLCYKNSVDITSYALSDTIKGGPKSNSGLIIAIIVIIIILYYFIFERGPDKGFIRKRRGKR